MPIMSCQPFGQGRSFALSSDSTDAWGRDFERIWGEGDNRYFRKFWRNVVRWLAENSANANRRLKVETDKLIYRPGEPIRVTARAFDEHLEETQKYRVVARLVSAGFQGGEVTETSLSPRPGDEPYAAELKAPTRDDIGVDVGPAGTLAWKLQVTAYEQSRDRVASQAEVDLQVIDDSPEYRDPRPDHPRLEALAKGSGGSVLTTSAEVAALLKLDGPDESQVIITRSPAWDHPVLWLCLLALLATEWVVRRARGLA